MTKVAVGCSPIAKPTGASICGILIGTIDDDAHNTGRNSGRLFQLDRPGLLSISYRRTLGAHNSG